MIHFLSFIKLFAQVLLLLYLKKIIDNNNVIGLPTETVYGLATNAYSNNAVKKIFKLKKRPLFNPLIIHFKNLKDLKDNVICNASFMVFFLISAGIFFDFIIYPYTN